MCVCVCVIWKLPVFQFEVEGDLELAEVLRFSTCFMFSGLKPYEAPPGATLTSLMIVLCATVSENSTETYLENLLFK